METQEGRPKATPYNDQVLRWRVAQVDWKRSRVLVSKRTKWILSMDVSVCCAAPMRMIGHLEGWLFPFYYNFFNSLQSRPFLTILSIVDS